jgi:SAM-dependent methyltransferase
MTDNRDQRDFWTESAGPKWVAQQRAMDALMHPVLDGVLARADLADGQHVLDIGCGTGASVLAAAERVGRNGHVTGADISATLLGLARARTDGMENVTLIEADAADHRFEARADRLISRFGVMFFLDPAAAFANMRSGLKPGARVSFAAWGQIPNNPFFTVPAAAARAVLGAPPKPDPDGPGPFAFRDPERVRDILSAAGFAGIDIDVAETPLTPEGSLNDLAAQAMQIGPAEAAARHFEAVPDQRRALQAAVKEGFARFDGSGGLRIPAEINFVTATAP